MDDGRGKKQWSLSVIKRASSQNDQHLLFFSGLQLLAPRNATIICMHLHDFDCPEQSLSPLYLFTSLTLSLLQIDRRMQNNNRSSLFREMAEHEPVNQSAKENNNWTETYFWGIHKGTGTKLITNWICIPLATLENLWKFLGNYVVPLQFQRNHLINRHNNCSQEEDLSLSFLFINNQPTNNFSGQLPCDLINVRNFLLRRSCPVQTSTTRCWGMGNQFPIPHCLSDTEMALVLLFLSCHTLLNLTAASSSAAHLHLVN